MLKRDDRLELEIESVAYEGNAVARLDRLVVFVPYGVPGDRVRVRVTRVRRKYAEAVIEEVLRPSASRVPARCRYFGLCGGCRLQTTDYPEQLRIKHQEVRSLLQKIGGQEDPEVLPTLGAPEPYFYRNKMEFSFGAHRWVTRDEIETGSVLQRDFALGLHIPRRFDRILDLHDCRLQSERSVRIVNLVRDLACEHGWEPYESREHRGFLRNLIIREAFGTGSCLVALVTTRFDSAAAACLKQVLTGAEPGMTTLVNLVNPTRSPVATGLEEIVLVGSGYIFEQLGGLTFKLNAGAFFQPNSQQAATLFEVIRSFAELEPGMTVYDLFCGVGSIALWIARNVRSVLGVESYAGAVGLARENAQMNGVGNCTFLAADAVEALSSSAIERHGRPDVVILDPPRAGLHPAIIRSLLELRVRRVVYSSCNPATQARDLALLEPAFRLDRIQPVDMFPQTYHIECVAQLTLRSR